MFLVPPPGESDVRISEVSEISEYQKYEISECQKYQISEYQKIRRIIIIKREYYDDDVAGSFFSIPGFSWKWFRPGWSSSRFQPLSKFDFIPNSTSSQVPSILGPGWNSSRFGGSSAHFRGSQIRLHPGDQVLGE